MDKIKIDLGKYEIDLVQITQLHSAKPKLGRVLGWAGPKLSMYGIAKATNERAEPNEWKEETA